MTHDIDQLRKDAGNAHCWTAADRGVVRLAMYGADMLRFDDPTPLSQQELLAQCSTEGQQTAACEVYFNCESTESFALLRDAAGGDCIRVPCRTMGQLRHLLAALTPGDA